MWPILGILFRIARVYGTCFECCRPDCVCDTMGAFCVHCDQASTRCVHPPGYPPRTRRYETEGAALPLLLVVGTCALCACSLRSNRSPTIPAMNVVASPPETDGFATGLIEGVLHNSDAPHDHSPEPEPPSYVEATSKSDV